jgi:hypothetical protein
VAAKGTEARAAIRRACLALLVLVVALGVSEWTVWTATVTSDKPTGAAGDTCEAAGDHYHQVAARPLTEVPNQRSSTGEDFRAAREERRAQKAERRHALRAFAEACEVGAAGPSA